MDTNSEPRQRSSITSIITSPRLIIYYLSLSVVAIGALGIIVSVIYHSTIGIYIDISDQEEHRKLLAWQTIVSVEMRQQNISSQQGIQCGNEKIAGLIEALESLNPGQQGRNADLTAVALPYAYLSRADLQHAELSKANLRCADLSEAKLEGARLDGADLTQTNLRGANLREAYLSGAMLNGAYLSAADLSGADLSGAKLIKAKINGGANLSGANLSGAVLIDANLSFANMNEAILANAQLDRADLFKAVLCFAVLDNEPLLPNVTKNSDTANLFREEEGPPWIKSRFSKDERINVQRHTDVDKAERCRYKKNLDLKYVAR